MTNRAHGGHASNEGPPHAISRDEAPPAPPPTPTQSSRRATAKVRRVAVIAVRPPIHKAMDNAIPKPRSHWTVIALRPGGELDGLAVET